MPLERSPRHSLLVMQKVAQELCWALYLLTWKSHLDGVGWCKRGFKQTNICISPTSHPTSLPQSHATYYLCSFRSCSLIVLPLLCIGCGGCCLCCWWLLVVLLFLQKNTYHTKCQIGTVQPGQTTENPFAGEQVPNSKGKMGLVPLALLCTIVACGRT